MDAFGFRYTDFNIEAPVVISDATPLANAALQRSAAMVDVSVERSALVYKITHKVSGKSYIGITTQEDPRERWSQHFRALGRGTRITKAIRKYGRDAFLFEVVYEAVNYGEACMVERGLIAQYGTMVPSRGYNQSVGGEAYPGGPLSERVKAKLSKSVRKYWSDPENRQRMITAFGKRTWPETHLEHLRKQAAAMKGKKRRSESVEKGRRSLMGHSVSEETRKRLSEAHKGKPRQTEESKARISKGNRGLVRTAEQKERMATGQAKAWADPERKAARLEKGRMKRAATRFASKEN